MPNPRLPVIYAVICRKFDADALAGATLNRSVAELTVKALKTHAPDSMPQLVEYPPPPESPPPTCSTCTNWIKNTIVGGMMCSVDEWIERNAIRRLRLLSSTPESAGGAPWLNSDSKSEML